MARPFLWQEGFESGTTIATAVVGTLIDVPHFTELARQGMAPHRGAYCLRVRLANGTTSQYIREDTIVDDLDDTVTRWVKFWFYLGNDLVMAASDKFTLLGMFSTTVTTAEVACGIVNTSGVLQFWFSETAATTAVTKDLGSATLGWGTALGKWHHVELKMLLGGAGAGTIDAWLDDSPLTQASTVAQANIVDMEIGVLGPDAGTRGTVLIDDIVYDDAQNFMEKKRFHSNNALVYYASDHPIIGPACFSAAFYSSGTDAVCRMYDTDGIPTNLDNQIGSPLSPITAKEVIFTQDILEVKYGLYTVITGTATDNKELTLSIEHGGIPTEGGLISYGRATKTPLPR